MTKRADGRVQSTVGLPGSGIGYTSASRRPPSRSTSPGRASQASRRGQDPRQAATRIARQQVPMTPRIKRERVVSVAAIATTVASFAVPPLLLVAIPCLLAGLVMMLTNLKDERRWHREYKAARAQALSRLVNADR